MITLPDPERGEHLETEEKSALQEDTARPFREIPRLWLKFGRMTKDFLISEQPRSSLKTTFISITIYAFIRAFLHFLFRCFDLIIIPSEQTLAELFSKWGGEYLTLSCGIFLVLLLSFLIYSSILFLSAKLIGGKGNYTSQTYLLSLIIAPLGLISAVFWFLIRFLPDILNILGWVGLQILRFIYLLRVFKAAHKMTTSQAFFSYMLPHGLIFFILIFIILPWLERAM